jgi:hypothetical protein
MDCGTRAIHISRKFSNTFNNHLHFTSYLKEPILSKMKYLSKTNLLRFFHKAFIKMPKKVTQLKGVFLISSFSRFHSSQDMRFKLKNFTQYFGLMIVDQNSVALSQSLKRCIIISTILYLYFTHLSFLNIEC